jgi:hypothetical protein
MVRRLDQEPVPSQKGGRFISPPLLASGFLTQSQLKKLYHHCGEHLHRGSLSDFMSRKNMKVDFSPIGKAVDKIVHLLDYHRIQLIDGAHEYG